MSPALTSTYNRESHTSFRDERFFNCVEQLDSMGVRAEVVEIYSMDKSPQETRAELVERFRTDNRFAIHKFITYKMGDQRFMIFFEVDASPENGRDLLRQIDVNYIVQGEIPEIVYVDAGAAEIKEGRCRLFGRSTTLQTGYSEDSLRERTTAGYHTGFEVSAG